MVHPETPLIQATLSPLTFATIQDKRFYSNLRAHMGATTF